MANNGLKMTKKDLQLKAFNKIVEFYEKYKNEKPIRRICNHNIDVIIYRRLLIQKYFDEIDVFDSSTDIYRPITFEELKELDSIAIDIFCDNLFLSSSIERINNNRYAMQLGIAKQNEKQKEYHYKIAMQEIKTLREFFGNQQ